MISLNILKKYSHNKLSIYASIITLLLSLISDAAAENNLKSRMQGDALNSDKKKFLTLTVENDLFGTGTDHNYTNGIRIGWFEVGKKPPGITKDLEKILPFLDINETTSVSYSIGHNLYTPDDIESSLQDPNDRPWAAFLYGSMAMVTLEDNYIDEYEITIGVVGPLALGEEIQSNWHEMIGSPDPKGWDNQIKNEPAIMLSFQRRWPETWYDNMGNIFVSLSPHIGITAGNIYSYVSAGGTLKMSLKNGRWGDKPLSVRPSIPGTGYFQSQQLGAPELFFGLEARAVARNIFLDGNSFSNSHSISKRPIVMDATAGLAFTWKQTRLSYMVVYRTKEFEGQDLEDVFGAISIGYNF